MIFVEGGGMSKDLRARCRQGFHDFLMKGLRPAPKPRIVACGSRWDAFDRFRTAIQSNAGGFCLLLVDSEDLVERSPWEHVRCRPDDRWEKPAAANDDNLHFMAVCMESWLVSDRDSLSSFYHGGFEAARLPMTDDLERVDKAAMLAALEHATRNTTEGQYVKGKVSFAALAAIDINVVQNKMSYCRRLVERLLAIQDRS